MTWIKRLYIIFLGIILSITTGFGLAAFYPQPVLPNILNSTPNAISQSCYATPQNQTTPECQKEFKQQDALQKKVNAAQTIYTNKTAGYTRTAVFLGIVIGSLFAIIGVALIRVSSIVSNGFLLGGVSTAILARLLINLASFGSSAVGTNNADAIAFIEFTALLLLSSIVVLVGIFSLKEQK